MGHFERLARRGGGGGSPHRSNDAAADHAEAMGAAVDESAMRPSSRLSERCLGALELIGGTTWREELVLGMVEPSRSSHQEATRAPLARGREAGEGCGVVGVVGVVWW